LAIVGVVNLTAKPAVSRPPGAWLLSYNSLRSLASYAKRIDGPELKLSSLMTHTMPSADPLAEI
jgi:hypothetical protein